MYSYEEEQIQDLQYKIDNAYTLSNGEALTLEELGQSYSAVNESLKHVLGQLHEQYRKNNNLFAVLNMVEWVDPEGSNLYKYCPWCFNTYNYGHRDDCARKNALTSL